MGKPIVHLVAGARPNFMKIAPLWHALKDASWCEPKIIHTGQHSDINMSDWFFRDLQLPAPHGYLRAQTGSHAKVTGSTMMAYEAYCQAERPAWTVVVGDVDSTIACAIAAKKLGIPVAHLEAGLRSFDRTMPEEMNRIVTDGLSDMLWTPSADADANLAREGISAERIKLVGNIMIDSLVMVQSKMEMVDLGEIVGDPVPAAYALLTLHRPSNVDNREHLTRIFSVLAEVPREYPLYFPVHPRTRRSIEAFELGGLLNRCGVILLEPQPYVHFLALMRRAAFILTDSGGVQEESSYMGVPCLTLRNNTERPVTVTEGTNRLTNLDRLAADIADATKRPRKPATIPYWDGNTAARVAASLKQQILAGGAQS